MPDASVIVYPCGCIERNGDFTPEGKPRKDVICGHGEETREGKNGKRWACERKNARERLPK